MPSLARVARAMVSRSTGGMPAGRSRSAGSRRTIAAISSASSSSGTATQTQSRRSRVTTHLHGLEHAHPSELGELALVCMEHELAGIAEAGLQDRALALAQHDRVGTLGGDSRCSGLEDVEEHAVQVQAV